MRSPTLDSFAICRISFWISGSRAGRPGPRGRPKAAHFLLINPRCQSRTVSGWPSIPSKAARFTKFRKLGRIAKSLMISDDSSEGGAA